jgi:hypothetical protein
MCHVPEINKKAQIDKNLKVNTIDTVMIPNIKCISKRLKLIRVC